jgi:hypothetical protein
MIKIVDPVGLLRFTDATELGDELVIPGARATLADTLQIRTREQAQPGFKQASGGHCKRNYATGAPTSGNFYFSEFSGGDGGIRTLGTRFTGTAV